MLSLILPYWDRQEAANRSLELLARTYKGFDFEVVIVDDGSDFIKPDVDLNMKVVRLPKKNVPKSPAVPLNEGVKASSGDVIVLSCIEILHETPVLQAMQPEGKDYILAAAWCPDEHKWHCHSSIHPPLNPKGTGLNFCAALRKELFMEAGGFDEDYRDGAGYEDNDFVNRLLKVGANFIHRDDLVVVHPKRGARTKWLPEMFSRNKQLFEEKWIH